MGVNCFTKFEGGLAVDDMTNGFHSCVNQDLILFLLIPTFYSCKITKS